MELILSARKRIIYILIYIAVIAISVVFATTIEAFLSQSIIGNADVRNSSFIIGLYFCILLGYMLRLYEFKTLKKILSYYEHNVLYSPNKFLIVLEVLFTGIIHLMFCIGFYRGNSLVWIISFAFLFVFYKRVRLQSIISTEQFIIFYGHKYLYSKLMSVGDYKEDKIKLITVEGEYTETIPQAIEKNEVLKHIEKVKKLGYLRNPINEH